ncbi:hypothetical protein ACU5AX_11025 [Sphingomonas sp. XXL09]|uniref:hypothetical protein n=1 Tax=Sphingomonas sp. XXL09 TaxID=3457787 RepID=UPI00406BA07C
MTGEAMGGLLRRRHILLIHEDAFIGRYLAEVIMRSGGTVTHLPGVTAGAAPFDILLLACALVLSDTAPASDAVAAAAAERGLPFAIVRSAQRACAVAPTEHVLTAPFAGFQVVELLHHMLERQEPAIGTAADRPRHGG